MPDEHLKAPPDVGQPFSQFYLRPSAPLKDSRRFRNRLAAYMDEVYDDKLVDFLRLFSGAEQIHDPRLGSFNNLMRLIKRGDLRDVLDVITFFARFLSTKYYGQSLHEKKDQWRLFILLLFDSEAMGYVMFSTMSLGFDTRSIPNSSTCVRQVYRIWAFLITNRCGTSSRRLMERLRRSPRTPSLQYVICSRL
jgi:hypothetical protein